MKTPPKKRNARKLIDELLEDEGDENPAMREFRTLALSMGYDPDDPLDHELLLEEEKHKTEQLLKRSSDMSINRKCFKEVFLRA